jgi:hypothetical protein
MVQVAALIDPSLLVEIEVDTQRGRAKPGAHTARLATGTLLAPEWRKGRRGRLKIGWGKPRASSNLASGTK